MDKIIQSLQLFFGERLSFAYTDEGIPMDFLCISLIFIIRNKNCHTDKTTTVEIKQKPK